MIVLKDIKFSYKGDQNIFSNFSINVPNGIYGLVGVNGAGKSTLLKLIFGLLKKQSGDIVVGNYHIPEDRQKFLKSAGVVFENSIFPSWMKVFDQLVYVGQLRGLSRYESINQVDEFLSKFNLLEKRHEFVNSLSAGQKQRFTIIQACIGNPKYLFLDEPTSNLDAHSRINVLKFLKSLANNNNCNILIFSHILSDLERFCDAYGILHKGKLLLSQTILELRTNNYHEEYVVRYEPHIDSENLRTVLSKMGTIEEQLNNEYVLRVPDNKTHKKLVNYEFSNGINISPSRSLLEQVFLKLTGVSE